MSTEQDNVHHEKRVRRSRRIGIVALILVALITVAVVWGIAEWTSDDDVEDPAVIAPTSQTVAMHAGQWLIAS